MSVLSLPRILVAGASSGCGKTTVVCALLTLLCRRGVRPAAFKCGPDYIDPMFHGAVTGVGCINLDPFFAGEIFCGALPQKMQPGMILL